ncbi:hypothetical protein AJ79_09749 [Helicocarpus griseus UAMH5409]|uniref:Uncharacterized protein n=1 Tax=Helicocarpus griseus UAMH5409 TaxID=1447875 RepID=A0A2B7WHR0_9EURO|nr:hypothetical protein AJ79_09749 [Helicocarpus griseus UAMH5409]
MAMRNFFPLLESAFQNTRSPALVLSVFFPSQVCQGDPQTQPRKYHIPDDSPEFNCAALSPRKWENLEYRDAGNDPPLSRDQLEEILRGRYPVDYLGEMIRLRTSENEFISLQQAFMSSSSRPFKSPKVSFHKEFSTTSLRPTRSALYVTVVSNVYDVVSQKLKDEGKRGIFQASFGEAVCLGDGSRVLEPDFILWKTSSNQYPILVMEVGFSEGYEELKESANTWFEKSKDVKMVLLCKIDERPLYRIPQALKVEELAKMELSALPIFQLPATTDVKLEDEKNLDSPIMTSGHRFVGRLKHVYFETWVRSEAGKAVRKGDRIYVHSPDTTQNSFTINLNEILPPTDSLKEPEVVFDFDDLKDDVNLARRRLAVFRCQGLVYQRLQTRKKRGISD